MDQTTKDQLNHSETEIDGETEQVENCDYIRIAVCI